MINKFTSFLAWVLNLGLLIFLLVGATLYAPDSLATPILWLIAFAVIVWGVMEILYRKNSRHFEKDIKIYYSTNDPVLKNNIQKRYTGNR